VTGQRVVIDQLGSDPLDAIEHHAHLEPMAMPDPASLGPREVVVEVKSAAVGWVDLIMASGQYQHVPVPPYTPGLELAGVIAWAGAAAGAEANVAVGSRVLLDPFVVGPRTSGAYRAWGGFASYAVAPAEAVRAIPGELTFDQAAALHGSYETAYHCLIARGHVAAGETVVILGATGAVGLAAVHVAKLAGATVVAVGRSPEKLAVVRAQGADHVVTGGELKNAVKALTGGRGADVIYDGVGGELSIEAMRAARFGARYLIVGWASTPQARGAPNQLPSNLIMMKGLDVLGCPAVISTQRDPSIRAPRLAQIFAWANAGRLVPYVSHRFALADFKAAMLAKWRGEVIGGCVVNP
jgi:NADPH2:quinone reductase